MRKILPLLTLSILISACSKFDQEIDMLSVQNKWISDSGIHFEDHSIILEGEYMEAIFNPGIFKTFTNFELSAEIKSDSGAVAGILFHTGRKNTEKGYEVIIDNSKAGNWEHLLKTGSLNSIRNIHYNMIDDGKSFALKILVVENHIKIFINNYPVVDYIEPGIPFRTSETEKMLLGSGTFALRSHFGNTKLSINKLHVTPLPKGDIDSLKNADYTRELTQLNIRKLPVVDYHVHEKGDLTMLKLHEKSAKSGINYGIAANCGLKFPIQTDEELEAYLNSIEGMPIFRAMQAEGREWVDMFSPELVARFDYAFTDAMTWTNKNGTRMRLWIPEETEVGDPEDFMEQLVSQIEKVVTEPIAIYVNPTYLPEEIADKYDELWTDDRIDRVVAALKENNVALEINHRLELPGGRVIQKAKEAGVKFAMGTNNTNSENLQMLEWSIKMVEEYNLQPADMFLPGEE